MTEGFKNTPVKQYVFKLIQRQSIKKMRKIVILFDSLKCSFVLVEKKTRIKIKYSLSK